MSQSSSNSNNGAGALVLAHSLRDGGTTKKLGVLVTLDSVAAEAITELKASSLDNNQQDFTC